MLHNVSSDRSESQLQNNKKLDKVVGNLLVPTLKFSYKLKDGYSTTNRSVRKNVIVI